MMKTCPQCGFESIDAQKKCPNCGFEFVKADEANEKEAPHTNETVSEKNPQQNDDIRWSDFKDVPLGELIEHFEDKNETDESKNNQSEDDVNVQELITNPNIEQTLVSKETLSDASETIESQSLEYQSAEQSMHSGNESNEVSGSDKGIQSIAESSAEPNDLVDSAEVPEDHDSAILSAYIRQHKNSEMDEDATDVPVIPEVTDDKEALPLTEEQSQSGLEDEQTDTAAIAESSESPQSTESPQPKIEAEETKLAEIPEKTAVSENTKSKTDPLPKNKKSRKKFYVAAAALVLVSAGGWYYYEETARQEQIATASELDQIEADLADFYTDDNQGFIKADKTTMQLTALTDRLAKYKTESRYPDLLAQSETIKEKMATLSEINGYFTSPVIIEDQLQKVSLKEPSAVTMSKRTAETPFDQLVNRAIDQGQKEYAQIEEVRNAVKSMVALNKEGELSDKVTRKSYNDLVKKIDALPIASLKEQLTAEIAPIDSALKKKEAAEKAAKEKAAQEAAQVQAEKAAAAQETTTANNSQSSEADYVLSPNTPTNTNNQPIIPARESDLADSSNPAWNWAPGVQEKIIATAIARGYVVEGGYTFERVRIVNGEGYYNFYATNNQGSLLKGTGDSAFPMYLFTVNAKTGYFRGNGNDHTIR